MANKEKLIETKGRFEFVGIVAGLTRNNAFTEEKTKKDPNKKWRRLRFNIKTSKANSPTVEIMGSQVDTVKIKKKENKAEERDIPFTKRNSLPEGWYLGGMLPTIGLEKEIDDKGVEKLKFERLHGFDAVDKIYTLLKDGMSVKVTGRIEYSEYKDKQGKMKRQVTYRIDYIALTQEPVDFDAQDFEEQAFFHQEIVYDQSALIDGKLHVDGICIAYNKTFAPAQFVIDTATHPKLADNVSKRLKFGDTIPVYGRVISGAVAVEATTIEEDDWGSDENPIPNATEWVNEMRITGVESANRVEGVYTEEDFAPSEEEQNYGNDAKDEEGSWNDNEDDLPPIDISDDDLPF